MQSTTRGRFGLGSVKIGRGRDVDELQIGLAREEIVHVRVNPGSIDSKSLGKRSGLLYRSVAECYNLHVRHALPGRQMIRRDAAGANQRPPEQCFAHISPPAVGEFCLPDKYFFNGNETAY